MWEEDDNHELRQNMWYMYLEMTNMLPFPVSSITLETLNNLTIGF